MLIYVKHIRVEISSFVDRENYLPLSAEKMHKEWYDLSWSGKDPLRVIDLAEKMSRKMEPFQGAKHKASSLYSQVKHLIKKGKVFHAVVYFLAAKKWANLALNHAQQTKAEIKPIDLEVLGAPDFMLAKTPIIGSIWKDKAMEFLTMAYTRWSGKPTDLEPNDPLEGAIILSKMHSLNKKGDIYKNLVRTVGLNRNMDQGQLMRVAKHLGFKTLDELFTFCNI